jgi:hypothetical protein
MFPECGEVFEFLISGFWPLESGKLGVGMEIPLVAHQPNPVVNLLYLV